jgi:hypothetical protein
MAATRVKKTLCYARLTHRGWGYVECGSGVGLSVERVSVQRSSVRADVVFVGVVRTVIVG